MNGLCLIPAVVAALYYLLKPTKHVDPSEQPRAASRLIPMEGKHP